MVSDCCGVPVYRGDICSRCKEHCESVDDGYDAAVDAYNEGYGEAVTERQIREERDWERECRRNEW